MHVGSVLLFDGEAPPYEDFVAQLERRAAPRPALPPEARLPAARAEPARVGRRPALQRAYHVRHTALPGPAGEARAAPARRRVFAQRLDRTKPLWELWLVDRVGDDRFAIISKTHHALVDGISGVDIATVLFDLEPDPPERAPARRGCRGPSPAGARCSPTR